MAKARKSLSIGPERGHQPDDSSGGPTNDADWYFRRYYASLVRYCYRLTGDLDRADDVAQETFVRLHENRVSGAERQVTRWLWRTAHNLLVDQARTTARRGRVLGAYARWRRSYVVATPEVALDVRRALDRLGGRDRRLLLLREEGFSYAEIADLIDVSPTSVGALLVRARRRFIHALGGSEELP